MVLELLTVEELSLRIIQVSGGWKVFLLDARERCDILLRAGHLPA
jgi:hypothetical protein